MACRFGKAGGQMMAGLDVCIVGRVAERGVFWQVGVWDFKLQDAWKGGPGVLGRQTSRWWLA